MDLEAISPAAVRILLTSRPPGVRVALAAALDNWAAMRQVYRSDQAGASKITEIAPSPTPTRGGIDYGRCSRCTPEPNGLGA